MAELKRAPTKRSYHKLPATLTLLLCLVYLLLSTPSFAVPLDRNSDNEDISAALEYLPDHQQLLDIDRVANDSSLVWLNNGRRPNLGLNTKLHWFRMKLTNTDSVAFNKLIQLRLTMPRSLSIYAQLEQQNPLLKIVKTLLKKLLSLLHITILHAPFRRE